MIEAETTKQKICRAIELVSNFVFALLTLVLCINALGIPMSLSLEPTEIKFERPPHIYMLENSTTRLSGPIFFDVMPEWLFSTDDKSGLMMFEDGKPLGKGGSPYVDMIDIG